MLADDLFLNFTSDTSHVDLQFWRYLWSKSTNCSFHVWQVALWRYRVVFLFQINLSFFSKGSKAARCPDLISWLTDDFTSVFKERRSSLSTKRWPQRGEFEKSPSANSIRVGWMLKKKKTCHDEWEVTN